MPVITRAREVRWTWRYPINPGIWEWSTGRAWRTEICFAVALDKAKCEWSTRDLNLESRTRQEYLSPGFASGSTPIDLGRIVSVVSHELRTPLTSIRGLILEKLYGRGHR
jgi:signal transduction histidine kinase